MQKRLELEVQLSALEHMHARDVQNIQELQDCNASLQSEKENAIQKRLELEKQLSALEHMHKQDVKHIQELQDCNVSLSASKEDSMCQAHRADVEAVHQKATMAEQVMVLNQKLAENGAYIRSLEQSKASLSVDREAVNEKLRGLESRVHRAWLLSGSCAFIAILAIVLFPLGSWYSRPKQQLASEAVERDLALCRQSWNRTQIHLQTAESKHAEYVKSRQVCSTQHEVPEFKVKPTWVESSKDCWLHICVTIFVALYIITLVATREPTRTMFLEGRFWASAIIRWLGQVWTRPLNVHVPETLQAASEEFELVMPGAGSPSCIAEEDTCPGQSATAPIDTCSAESKEPCGESSGEADGFQLVYSRESGSPIAAISDVWGSHVSDAGLSQDSILSTGSWAYVAAGGGERPCCFLPETMFIMQDQIVQVRDVKRGHKLTGPAGEVGVTWIKEHPEAPRSIVSFATNGMHIEITGDHRVMVNVGHGPVPMAAEDVPSDALLCCSSGDLPVTVARKQMNTLVFEIAFTNDDSVYMRMIQPPPFAIVRGAPEVPVRAMDTIEFKFKGPICEILRDSGIEQWFVDNGFDISEWGLHFRTDRPYAFWVPRQHAQWVYELVSEGLPSPSKLYRGRVVTVEDSIMPATPEPLTP